MATRGTSGKKRAGRGGGGHGGQSGGPGDQGGRHGGQGGQGGGQHERRGMAGNSNKEGRMRVAQETLAILDSGSFSSPTGVSLDISAALSQCSNQVNVFPNMDLIRHYMHFKASFWDREQLER